MATKQIKQPVNLVMTIDMGGSKTKIVVQELGKDSPRVLLMESQLADIDKASLDNLPTQGRPSDRAWVGFNKPSSDNAQPLEGGGGEVEKVYYAVGALARHRFGGLPQLHELKYELALPKICAAVWLARVEMSLPPKFNLFLTVLLPGGEISDEHILKSRCREVICSFDTPDGLMGIKLIACEVSSEGSGIYNFRKNTLGDKLYSKYQLYVMLGFRNASTFVVRGGVIEPGQTNDFGMHWLLDLLAGRVSGLDKNNPRTIETIIDGTTNPELLKRLSRKRSQQDIDVDFQSISAALKVVKDEYVRAIARWLKSIPGVFDEIVFCGGTAEYLRPELESYYVTDTTEVVWHGGVSIPTEFESLLGCYRLADVWALHETFFKIVSTKVAESTKRSASKKQVASSATAATSSTDSHQNLNQNTSYQSVIPPIGSGSNTAKVASIEYKRTERPADTLPPIGG
jgi:hypothetical protein